MNVEEPASLAAYLAQRGYAVEESRILLGGVSNNTVLVRLKDGSSIVVKQAREQLKSAAEWKCDPARIRQEALAMEWISRWAPAGGPLFRGQSFSFWLCREAYSLYAADHEPRAAVFLRELVKETQARRFAL